MEEALALLVKAYNGIEIPAPECDLDVVARNLEYIDRFNISGTPTIFFPDGSRFEGAVQSDELIAETLNTSGKDSPQSGEK